MDEHWMLRTNGDPLKKVQNFFRALWSQSSLNGMLLPIYDADSNCVMTYMVGDPEQLDHADPFAPVMFTNAAQTVVELTYEFPYDQFGVVLRACEIRALVEMSKKAHVDIDRVLIIGMDCLGTYHSEDYAWRVKRKGNQRQLTDDFLRFAPQGGILESRLRATCQICDLPTSDLADISLKILGLPVNEVILVSSPIKPKHNGFQIAEIVDGIASPVLVEKHSLMVNKLITRRNRVRQQVLASLDAELPRDPDELVEFFKDCGNCQLCFEACPLCAADFPQQTVDGRMVQDDVIRWLISCAECGMCEQVCPTKLPLGAIFSSIKRELAQAYQYTAGLAWEEEIPL